METDQLVIYYPEEYRDATLRIASRLEYCRTELMKLAPITDGPGAGAKSVFVMPEVPFNNAYVEPAFAGREQVAVLPQYSTIDYFITLGLPPDPGLIGCHEMVHDVVMRQLSGIESGIRYAFGEIMSPAAAFEGWFQEGIAVFYETRLLGLGRGNNKYFDGNLAAGIAGRRIDGSMAVTGHRLPNFGHYLIGTHFIDYLMSLEGEEALWEVIGRQSNELTWPFALNGRFQAVYGKTMRGLFKDFSKELQAKYPERRRPRTQRSLTKLGREALFTVSPMGRYAAITYDLDRAPVLEVYEPDGTKVHSRHLVDLLIGRRLNAPSVEFSSGLSMTADGKHVFFVALDRGPVYSESRLVHVDVERGELRIVNEDIGGAGGSVSPDGKRYYFVRPIADSYAIFEYELMAHSIRQITAPGPRYYHTGPIVSPDGGRLLVTESSFDGVGLGIWDVATGQRVQGVASPRGMTISGSWVDDTHVVYAADDGERLQVFETDLETNEMRRLTDAPYLVWEPYVANGRILFLNRHDWHFTVDETLYPSEDKVPFVDKERVAPRATPKAQKPEKTGYRVTSRDEQYGAFVWAAGFEQAAEPPLAPAETEEITSDADESEEQMPPPRTTETVAENGTDDASIGSPDGSAESPDGTETEVKVTANDQVQEKDDAVGASTEDARTVPAPGEDSEKSDHRISFAFEDHQKPQLLEVRVHSDKRYDPVSGFFTPRTWGPSVESREQASLMAGASIGGGDDLGYNRWLIGAGYDWIAELPNVKFQLINAMGAPYFISLDASHIGRSEETLDDFQDAPNERVQVRETIFRLDMRRTWYGSTTASLGLRYYDALYTAQESGRNFEALRLAGPGLAFSHVTRETTAYTGPRLGFAFSGAANYYPASFSVDEFDLVDVGGGLGVVFPLPLSRRHTLELGGSSRALLGAPEAAGMLQVGGAPTDGPLVADQGRPDGERIAGQVPPSISFRSDLRGFENLALFGSQVVSGEAEYTYPFIIDTGSLSTLYLFPSFLFRQIDLDLFFTSASLLEGEENEVAMAAGVALDFKLKFWNFPFQITLQESRRLSHDEEFAFYFGFGFDESALE